MFGLGMLFVIARILPMFVIQNGIQNLEPEHRQYGSMALSDLELSLSTPSFYKVYTTKFQVLELESGDDQCTYKAIIQSYGLFGVKLDTWLVDGCGSSRTI